MVLMVYDGLWYFAHPEMNWLATVNLLSCSIAHWVSIYLFWACADQMIYTYVYLHYYYFTDSNMLPLLFYLPFANLNRIGFRTSF